MVSSRGCHPSVPSLVSKRFSKEDEHAARPRNAVRRMCSAPPCCTDPIQRRIRADDRRLQGRHDLEGRQGGVQRPRRSGQGGHEGWQAVRGVGDCSDASRGCDGTSRTRAGSEFKAGYGQHCDCARKRERNEYGPDWRHRKVQRRNLLPRSAPLGSLLPPRRGGRVARQAGEVGGCVKHVPYTVSGQAWRMLCGSLMAG